MTELPRVQLVCFDVGGVLVRICRNWDEGCAAAGVDVRHTDAQFNAVQVQWYALVELHQTGRLQLDAYAEQVSALVDGLYSAAEIRDIHHAWLLEEYDGVRAVVDDLHTKGIRTAALSNTNHAHWQRMDEFPVMTRLDQLYASHELGLHKPDEAIYHAIEQREHCSGRHILFFDDLNDNILAARKLGWLAEVIDPQTCTATQIRRALQSHGVFDIALK